MKEELSSAPQLQRSILAASEEGAPAWLTTLPIAEHGFSLHKGAFRDALALRYGWPLKFFAEKCVCGSKFKPDHQMTCRQDGFISHRHNELRDLTAALQRRSALTSQLSLSCNLSLVRTFHVRQTQRTPPDSISEREDFGTAQPKTLSSM